MHVALFVKDFAVGEKFSKNGLPTKSGAEFHAENHALQLIKRGHRVSIFAKKRHFFTKSRENLNGIDLVRLHAPVRWLEILLRLFMTHRSIDVFYILGVSKFSVWAILYAKLFHKPVTMALTGKAEIFDEKKDWRNKIFAKCDAYLALSQEIKRGYIEQGGIAPEKIMVMGQGIDTRKFPRLTVEQKRSLRVKYGIPEDVPVLVFCARLVPDKGIEVLKKVWPVLHQRFPQAKFLLVGGGRKDVVQDLRYIVEQTDGSMMLIGEVDNPCPYYQMADVNIFPSKHEGLPTSLMEAMSCGLPGVVSHIGGCEDLITDGETGYLLPQDDASAFAEKITYLWRHPQEVERMGKNAARSVYEHCDYVNIIDKLVKVLATGRVVKNDEH